MLTKKWNYNQWVTTLNATFIYGINKFPDPQHDSVHRICVGTYNHNCLRPMTLLGWWDWDKDPTLIKHNGINELEPDPDPDPPWLEQLDIN